MCVQKSSFIDENGTKMKAVVKLSSQGEAWNSIPVR